MHRDEKFCFRHLENFRDEFPGERNRVFLEIIAEREIPHHLEKRMVPRGIADIVEIVMLAAGAHAIFVPWSRACMGDAPRR